MPKTTVFKGVGGFIVKHCGDYFRIPKSFVGNLDEAADVAKKLAKTPDMDTFIRKNFKTGKLRSHYLGKNPTKLGDTGQGIFRRMLNDGELYSKSGRTLKPEKFMDADGTIRRIGDADLKKIYIKDAAGNHHDLTKATMGHYPVDAVDYWTTTGYKSPPDANKAWMHDPDNYFFEYGPDNWSNGGKQRNVYTNADPVPPWSADVPGT
ncbi:hypothetical protein [Propioniferax innocua]|uniref:HNH/ENDO VII superfamily nuclease n=1 Tax=Propioniferax innocua TaxID=1753 RepID=A0A542ZQL3_9ACTN|nr:hypothetical protein [Propioniferax innocua]TQL62642.1 hypothetical protein FB460_0426 [Propioniferax innocua]